MMFREIVVIADTLAGRLTPVTFELVDFAKKLRGGREGTIRLFMLGDDIADAVAELAEIPDVAVSGISGRALVIYNGEAWRAVLTPLLMGVNPSFVCIAHTTTGLDYAPGLAACIRAGCITAVENVREEAGETIFQRSILKGKIRSEVSSRAETTVVTLLPGVFSGSSSPGRPGAPLTETMKAEGDHPTARPEILSAPEMELKSRSFGMLPAPENDAELTGAEVVVAAGRGIGKEENLVWLRELAALFSRSTLGASRTVCDAGWLPTRLQIGQTGKTVAPKLYIACGISGALQHLMGMRGSQFVVAINSDPRAAIFQIADVAVVEDLLVFAPLLINACKKLKHSPEAGKNR